jgi:hypothetical protein
MRVMLMIKGDPEPGAVPSEELLTAMGRYNDELTCPFEALSRIYPGEYGAHGEIEIRQVFEPERSDASN